MQGVRLTMKHLICIALISVTHCLATDWTLVRRLTQAAGCAASMIDAKTTLDASRYGAIETNPILGGGRPGAGRIVGIKLGLCAGQIVWTEWSLRKARGTEKERRLEMTAAAANLGAVGVY